MSDWNAARRPVSVREMSIVLKVPPARLRRLIERHLIRPSCQIENLKLYGPAQIRRLYDLTEPRVESAAV